MSTGGAKWADVPTGAIAAGVADMEVDPPGTVGHAVRVAVAERPGYPAPAEVAAVVAAGVGWHGDRHGLDLDPDHCVPVSSLVAAAAWTLVRVTEPGDAVVRIRPGYPPLTDIVRDTGRTDRPVDLVRAEGDRWVLDLDALERACAGARVLVWVSPHNPTGRLWRRDEVRAVASIAAQHDLLVIADEAWADIVLVDRPHVPFATVAREVHERLAARTVTLLTTTKTWNLAGLGCGLLHAGGADLVERLRGTGHVPMLATPDRTALAASTAAWRDGGPWLEDTLAHVRAVVADATGRLAASYGTDRVTVPEATYTVWLDLRGLTAADDPHAALAVPDGVVPVDGGSYGAAGFVRLNLATSAQQASAVIERVTRLVPPPG